MGSDSRMYPQGRGMEIERYVLGTLVQFGIARTLRTRVTTAQVNAGLVLLPALPGVRWRLIDAWLIAIGGAASGATTVDLIGTASAATVKLLAAAVAGLTQSTILRAGAANATVLADGASFVQMDANTAVSASKTGGSLATSTNIDYFIEYTADAA